MTAFFSHCWRNARPRLVLALACCLLAALPFAASAQTPAAEVTQLRLDLFNESERDQP